MVHEAVLNTKEMSLNSSNKARWFTQSIQGPWIFPCDIDQGVWMSMFLLDGLTTHVQWDFECCEQVYKGEEWKKGWEREIGEESKREQAKKGLLNH